jgi:hypothetical protein
MIFGHHWALAGQLVTRVTTCGCKSAWLLCPSHLPLAGGLSDTEAQAAADDPPAFKLKSNGATVNPRGTSSDEGALQNTYGASREDAAANSAYPGWRPFRHTPPFSRRFRS